MNKNKSTEIERALYIQRARKESHLSTEQFVERTAKALFLSTWTVYRDLEKDVYKLAIFENMEKSNFFEAWVNNVQKQIGDALAKECERLNITVDDVRSGKWTIKRKYEDLADVKSEYFFAISNDGKNIAPLCRVFYYPMKVSVVINQAPEIKLVEKKPLFSKKEKIDVIKPEEAELYIRAQKIMKEHGDK